jgi:dipeptidyl aminopeptidase/acylaminoacyl peptidase
LLNFDDNTGPRDATGRSIVYSYGDASISTAVSDPFGNTNGVLYFASDRTGKSEIHRIDSTGQVVRVTNTPGLAQSWSPVRGPGALLYWVSDRDGSAVR